MQLSSLHFWFDSTFRSPAEQMAIDEALFDRAVAEGLPLLRAYHWNEEVVTLGYFSKWEAGDTPKRVVRRWTGGGRVEHGEDFTYALAIPRTEMLATLPGEERYAWIHARLREALARTHMETVLEDDPSPTDRPPDGPGACFSRPVASDLLDDTGRKVAGGAQRRVAGAILHQGSVRLPAAFRPPDSAWTRGFMDALALDSKDLPQEWSEQIIAASRSKQGERYESESWNRRV